jgi:hypothetical protein
MPITYEINRAASLIRTRCYGHVTLADVRDHFKVLALDPDRPDHLDVFLDLREMTSPIKAEEIREASKTISRVPPSLRFGACAVVAERDALYGMSRMFSVFAEPFFRVIQAFRSAPEAEAWLAEQRAQTQSSEAAPKRKGAA